MVQVMVIRSWRAALAATAAALAAMTAAPPAEAQRTDWRSSADHWRDDRADGRVIPAREAVAVVKRAYPGCEVLNTAVQMGPDRKPLYHIVRIITRDGVRRDVRVDARSGRLIGGRR